MVNFPPLAFGKFSFPAFCQTGSLKSPSIDGAEAFVMRVAVTQVRPSLLQIDACCAWSMDGERAATMAASINVACLGTDFIGPPQLVHGHMWTARTW